MEEKKKKRGRYFNVVYKTSACQGVKGASDLQELEKDGEAIIKGLMPFLKGSPTGDGCVAKAEL